MGQVGIKEATKLVFERCLHRLSLAPSDETPQIGTNHLMWMCREAISHIETWPIDKSNRWLGYVQGVATAKGLMSPDIEREATRPIFHRAYRIDGENIPETSAPDLLSQKGKAK